MTVSTLLRTLTLIVLLALAGMFVTTAPAFAQEAAQEESELGSWATQLFKYAMGRSGTASCLTCDFIGYFMLALTNFSATVFDYFLGAFRLIVPVLMAIWIGYRVAKLMSVGGEDGRTFIYSIVTKLTLFAILWMVTTSAIGTHQGEAINGTRYNLWRWTGPVYLETAFELSGDIRDHAITQSSGLGMSGINPGEAPFGCQNVQPAVGSIITNADTEYVRAGIEITCVTERTHMIGIASGLAVIFTSWSGSGGLWSQLVGDGLAAGLLLGLVKIFAGAMMMAVYILSAVWLIFLILDVVTRSLITAAFSPVISAMYLFQPTRGFAVSAIKALAGAMITAIALSIIAILSFFLMTNVIEVYNAMWPSLDDNYSDYNLQSIPTDNLIDAFGTFIERIQESRPGEFTIPMDFSTPWFYYICMAGIATFALGKKIIDMLEGMIGYQGAAAFADNALKMTKAGAVAGMGAAGIGAVLARKTAGAGIGVAGFSAAGTMKLAGAGGSALAMGAQNIGHRFLNPFHNPAGAAARSSISSTVMKGKMGAEAASGALNAASEEGN